MIILLHSFAWNFVAHAYAYMHWGTLRQIFVHSWPTRSTCESAPVFAFSLITFFSFLCAHMFIVILLLIFCLSIENLNPKYHIVPNNSNNNNYADDSGSQWNHVHCTQMQIEAAIQIHAYTVTINFTPVFFVCASCLLNFISHLLNLTISSMCADAR